MHEIRPVPKTVPPTFTVGAVYYRRCLSINSKATSKNSLLEPPPYLAVRDHGSWPIRTSFRLPEYPARPGRYLRSTTTLSRMRMVRETLSYW